MFDVRLIKKTAASYCSEVSAKTLPYQFDTTVHIITDMKLIVSDRE